MALITVVYRGTLAEYVGRRDEQLEAATVADVLHHIKSSYGKTVYHAAKPMLIVVNGVSILQKKVFATTLVDGDVVTFLPLAAGG